MHSRIVIAIVAAGLTCSAGSPTATTPQKKKSTHRKTTRKPVAHPAHSAPSRWHAGQTAPTPDRYKEIQSALAKKGYLQGEATGVWNQDSSDALRRFQQDQNLQASGKLDSLSLIALGLGPKH